MVFRIRFKRIAAVALTLLAAAVFVTGFRVLAERMAPASLVSRDLPVVILDAGHGGFDGGAVAPDGTLEKDLNLQIAQNLRDLLVPMGFEVIMVRDGDVATDDPNAVTIRQRKNSDLRNRLKLTEKYTNSVLLSIHLNKFEQSQYSGAQVFYGPGQEDSKLLAECIQESIKAQLQPENTRAVKKGTKDTYLLYNAKIPAVIVECGFLSNSAELQKLKDEEYQKKMAFSILLGFFDYMDAEEPKT